MTELFSGGLFVPALVLAVLAWVIPKVLSLALPEGVRPLMANALLSTLILFAISTLFFLMLYVVQGAPWEEIAQFGLAENIVFFGRLGLISALIWAPIMVISVANLPRTWTKETW